MIKNLLNRHFIMNVYILMIFLLPNNIIYYGIMYLFLLVTMRFKAVDNLAILGCIVLSFLLNINSYYDIKDLLIAFNIGFLLCFFPFFYRKVNIKIFVIYIIAGTVLLSQLVFILKVPFLMNVFEAVYKDSNSEDEFTRFIVGTERNGGLYYNPNQASKYLTILLTILLVLKYRIRDKIIISLALITSVFLTGSRTGFFILIMILLGYSFFTIKNKGISVMIVLIGLISIFIFGTESRSFQFGESGSADYKVIALSNYWHTVTGDGFFANMLFGNFTSHFPTLAQKYSLFDEFGFDAEIGMMISAFGVLFIICYMFFYLKLLVHINRKNFIVLIPFIIWPLTSTILFSIKTSIVYFSVLAIVIYNTNPVRKKTI